LLKGVEDQVNQASPNLLYLMPKSGGAFGGAESPALTIDDCKIATSFSEVRYCDYYIYRPAVKVSFMNEEEILPVQITSDTYAESFKEGSLFSLSEGRIFDENEKGAVLGSVFKKTTYFSEPIELGDTIEINKEKFRVVGILEEIGNPQDDSTIMVGYSSAKNALTLGKNVMMMHLTLDKNVNATEVAQRVKDRFERRKGFEYSVSTASELLDEFSGILNSVKYGVFAIAGISLLVGALGISNTLFTSVTERKTDIGIMKAIGATNDNILFLIIIESIILSLIGAILGSITGFTISYFASELISQSGFKMKFYLDFSLLAFSFGFAIILGILSGIFPAKDAAKMDPIEAIRS
jgi:putative ABC transport system permease protein